MLSIESIDVAILPEKLAQSESLSVCVFNLGSLRVGSDHQGILPGHVDVKVHFLRDLVRNGHAKLVECAGTQNVLDALTK